MRRNDFDPHLSTCWVERMDFGIGLWLYAAFSRHSVGALGLVWGIPIGGETKRFDVLHSYVVPFARRKGIRSLIQTEILRTFDVITTNMGSDEGGRQFMEKFGYRHDPARAIWTYVKPRPRGKRKAA